mgnify:CR=1 FL=1
MNCIFIYNPVSGKGRIRKKIKYVVDKLREKYEIVDVYETRACGDMTAAAREAAKKYDISPADTLKIAQRLYELKYTTYPRSDCQKSEAKRS